MLLKLVPHADSITLKAASPWWLVNDVMSLSS